VTDLLSHLFLVVWLSVRSFQKLKVELGLKLGLVYTWLLREPLGTLLSESLPTELKIAVPPLLLLALLEAL
jgi:multisubunit Na+/H+ antiporter MnhE subunit